MVNTSINCPQKKNHFNFNLAYNENVDMFRLHACVGDQKHVSCCVFFCVEKQNDKIIINSHI